jgi:hypothetical protein
LIEMKDFWFGVFVALSIVVVIAICAFDISRARECERKGGVYHRSKCFKKEMEL